MLHHSLNIHTPFLWIFMRTSLIFMLLACWGVIRSLYPRARTGTYTLWWSDRAAMSHQQMIQRQWCKLLLRCHSGKKNYLGSLWASRKHSYAVIHQWLSKGYNLTCWPSHFWQNLLPVLQKMHTNPDVCPTGQHRLTLFTYWLSKSFRVTFLLPLFSFVI